MTNPTIDAVMRRVTRLEVIDDTGRVLVVPHTSKIGWAVQDDGRTLKLFVEGVVKR